MKDIPYFTNAQIECLHKEILSIIDDLTKREFPKETARHLMAKHAIHCFKVKLENYLYHSLWTYPPGHPFAKGNPK